MSTHLAELREFDRRIDPDREIAPQIARAAAFAEEGNCPYVLLMSKEDIQW